MHHFPPSHDIQPTPLPIPCCPPISVYPPIPLVPIRWSMGFATSTSPLCSGTRARRPSIKPLPTLSTRIMCRCQDHIILPPSPPLPPPLTPPSLPPFLPPSPLPHFLSPSPPYSLPPSLPYSLSPPPSSLILSLPPSFPPSLLTLNNTHNNLCRTTYDS